MTYAVCFFCREELDWLDERYHDYTLHHVHLMQCPKCLRYFIVFSNWFDAEIRYCDNPAEFDKIAQSYLSSV